MSEQALVVLVDSAQLFAKSGAFYVDGETCLNQLNAIADLVPRDVGITIFQGHSASKWDGRGRR